MSGPSPRSKKVPPPSLEKARCYWCGHEGRKDNLRKHHDQKHPGKEYKWKQILVEDQSSLLKHFPGKARSAVPEHEQQAAPTHAGAGHLDADTEGAGGDGVEPFIEPTDTPRKRFCSGELKVNEPSKPNQSKDFTNDFASCVEKMPIIPRAILELNSIQHLQQSSTILGSLAFCVTSM